MNKLIYWLSPLSALILIQIAGLINLTKLPIEIEGLIVVLSAISFIIITSISFQKIIDEEPTKMAIIHLFSFTILTPFFLAISLIISHNYLLYGFDSGCDFLCGIEILIFPILSFVAGFIINLALLSSRKKSNPKNPKIQTPL